MAEDEYQQLVKEYGEEKSQKCIKELDMYKKSKGVDIYIIFSQNSMFGFPKFFVLLVIIKAPIS